MINSLKVTFFSMFLLISSIAYAIDLDVAWKKANVALDRNDISAAVKYLQPAADAGDAEAQSFVGSVLWTGKAKGVPADPYIGTKYLRMCVNNVNGEAETRGNCAWLMATAYIRGDGVSKSANKSTEFLWTGARFGNKNSFGILNNSICKSDSSCTEELAKRVQRCEEICLN